MLAQMELVLAYSLALMRLGRTTSFSSHSSCEQVAERPGLAVDGASDAVDLPAITLPLAVRICMAVIAATESYEPHSVAPAPTMLGASRRSRLPLPDLAISR
jgi:hypothetical protein